MADLEIIHETTALGVVTEVVTVLEVAEVGPVGPPGKSAYEFWLEAGNVGSEAQFRAQLTAPEYANVRNKPLEFPPSPHQHIQADIPELEPLVNLTILFENALL